MRGRDAAILQTSSDGTHSNFLVLIKNIKSMAKLYIEGVCVMHDLSENVVAAAEMMPQGVNFKIVEG